MTYFLASTDSASSDFKDTKTKVVQQEHIISPLTAKKKEREEKEKKKKKKAKQIFISAQPDRRRSQRDKEH